MNVKWGKEKFSDVDLNTDEPPVVFKAQLFALSSVAPERQKVMVKGAVIKVKCSDVIYGLYLNILPINLDSYRPVWLNRIYMDEKVFKSENRKLTLCKQVGNISFFFSL